MASEKGTKREGTSMPRRSAAKVAVHAETAPLANNRLLADHVLPLHDAVDRRRVTINLAESPLAWLVRRDLISAVQFAAGERLRGDFMRAGQAPRITMRWDPVPVSRSDGGAVDPTTSQLAARQRFDAAVAAVGPGLTDVLWRVICMGEGLETAERALGWPSRAGKLVLRLALDRLATHYRLT
jgi:hypothetical protein